jgi:hypothetical protein
MKAKPQQQKPQPRMFASMTQCAASRTDWPRDMLRAAKRLGCSAFNANNTVSEALLDEWASDPEHRAALERECSGIREKVQFEMWRKLKIRNDRDEGKVVERAKVCAAIERLANRIVPMLSQKLEREMPQAVAMTPEDMPRCHIIGRNINDAILREFHGFAEEWK